MDHANHVRLKRNEIVPEIVAGAIIYGRDNATIGTIDHMQGAGDHTQIVIDVGGFLGIGAKRVALFASQLDFMRDVERTVHAVTQMTEEQLKALPVHVD